MIYSSTRCGRLLPLVQASCPPSCGLFLFLWMRWVFYGFSVLVAVCICGGRGPGCAPGGAVTFSCVTKRKSPKRRRPPVCVPHRPVGRWGQPAMLGSGVGVAELAPFPLRVNSAQTAATSQTTKRVCPSAHTPTSSCASRRSQQGWGAGTKTAAAAQLRLGVGDAREARCRRDWRDRSAQAERSNGPCGARSHPLLTVPRSAGPGVSACRRTRASLSGLPQLFERSSKNAASSAAHPRTEHRRLPHSPTGRVGTRAAGSPSLW